MLQTISGETRKSQIFDKKEIDAFFETINEEIKNQNYEKCLYQNKKIVSSRVLNFLNLMSEDKLYNQLKFILKEAYEDCEKIYPYLGNMLILKYFDNKSFQKIGENFGSKLSFFVDLGRFLRSHGRMDLKIKFLVKL